MESPSRSDEIYSGRETSSQNLQTSIIIEQYETDKVRWIHQAFPSKVSIPSVSLYWLLETFPSLWSSSNLKRSRSQGKGSSFWSSKSITWKIWKDGPSLSTIFFFFCAISAASLSMTNHFSFLAIWRYSLRFKLISTTSSSKASTSSKFFQENAWTLISTILSAHKSTEIARCKPVAFW